MPDSPGRELQVDVTCACNARFLATLDPHFISIETPSDRGKISARGSGRFCTARELPSASPVASYCEAIGTADESKRVSDIFSGGDNQGDATDSLFVSILRAGCETAGVEGVAWRSHRLRCLLHCPLPVHCLPAAGVLSALGARQWPGSWQGYSGVNVGVGGWVGAASVCGCRAACCRAACWPPGWLLAAGSDCHAVWLSPPPWQPGTETQCF